MTFRAVPNPDRQSMWIVVENCVPMERVIAKEMTAYDAYRIAEVLNKHGLSNLYDQLALRFDVPRDKVKGIILAASYSGGVKTDGL